MNAVKEDIPALVDKELAAANKKFPLFASSHEAYAVIFEEFQEAEDELTAFEIGISQMWCLIKENESITPALNELYKIAVRLVEEGTQMAAMCRKGIITELSDLSEDAVNNTMIDDFLKSSYR